MNFQTSNNLQLNNKISYSPISMLSMTGYVSYDAKQNNFTINVAVPVELKREIHKEFSMERYNSSQYLTKAEMYKLPDLVLPTNSTGVLSYNDWTRAYNKFITIYGKFSITVTDEKIVANILNYKILIDCINAVAILS